MSSARERTGGWGIERGFEGVIAWYREGNRSASRYRGAGRCDER
jgi:hypothetical protein